ncbi:MAG: hypothetical protein CV087_08410 [Candidatus Brocadia sp. WS118]|nr:MAG: hypothetical protein CV087_08410 [Candidatus Brocadia sp. WS118]
MSTDFYAPHNLRSNEAERKELFDKLDVAIQRSPLIEQPTPKENAYLKNLREDFYRRILCYRDGEMRAKLIHLCRTTEEILDIEVSFPIICTKLARMGDPMTDLIALYNAGTQFLDDLQLQERMEFARRQGEFIENTSKLQREKGGVSNSNINISDKNLDLAWARIDPDEYEIRNRVISFMKATVQTIKSFKELLESANYNNQKLAELIKT